MGLISLTGGESKPGYPVGVNVTGMSAGPLPGWMITEERGWGFTAVGLSSGFTSLSLSPTADGPWLSCCPMWMREIGLRGVTNSPDVTTAPSFGGGKHPSTLVVARLEVVFRFNELLLIGIPG